VGVGAGILELERSTIRLGEGSPCTCARPRTLGSRPLGGKQRTLASGARALGRSTL